MYVLVDMARRTRSVEALDKKKLWDANEKDYRNEENNDELYN